MSKTEVHTNKDTISNSKESLVDQEEQHVLEFLRGMRTKGSVVQEPVHYFELIT